MYVGTVDMESYFRAAHPYLHKINPELCLAGLPDVVVDGVLQGFYTRDVRVSFTAPTIAELEPTHATEA